VLEMTVTLKVFEVSAKKNIIFESHVYNKNTTKEKSQKLTAAF
jgi:hypothetical protein